ncbi:RusA family crossover junction endodeoxyribonuclease [Aurantimonas marianensis]|uniref:RusA family crossover junction endodeoxyribonuclease n=1 Tax=Aurantimonas marianensis TaxID=2920428 RepID=A0A9X2H9Y4_9HYPH|nr:RusA family crossover junction endodeoxyribonuclease [Aurantimonas marianensis]MCP3056533.1 RusA family crossover junction endodeoxyribonuclease [Aurantimonas marianensis]
MEIEFLVYGTPVALSSRNRRAKDTWQARVRDGSTSAIPEPHFAFDGAVAVTIYYFPPAPMQGDIDNIVKWILDSLTRHIYIDDQQVERIVVQKFEPGKTADFLSPTPVLTEAIEGQRPVVYIRISDDPLEDLR